MKKTVLLLLCVLMLLPLYGCDKNDEPDWRKKVDSIEAGMTLSELIELMGEPDADLGSGATIYMYTLPDEHVLVVSISTDYKRDVPADIVAQTPVLQTYDEFYARWKYYPNDAALLSDYVYRHNDGVDEIVLQLLDGYSAMGPFLSDEICFDSFDEMVRDIRLGSFTEEEMIQIYYFHKDYSKPIPVYDLDKLYMPVLPDGLTYRIFWEGDTYRCATDAEKFSFSYYFVPDEMWQSYCDPTDWKLVSTENNGAKVYLVKENYWHDTHCRVRDLSEGKDTIQVFEYYYDYPQKRQWYIVKAERNGIRYLMQFYFLKEEPTVEFIRQLGVAPYTGE